jgi:hypothetical protein
MINFRELIQNTKYGFQKAAFIGHNSAAIRQLFDQGQLHQFAKYISKVFLQQLQNYPDSSTPEALQS